MCDFRFWVDRVHACLDGKNLLEKVGFSWNKFSTKEGSSLSSNKSIMYIRVRLKDLSLCKLSPR